MFRVRTQKRHSFLELNNQFEASVYEFQVTSLNIYNVLELNPSHLHLAMSQRKQRLCESSPYEHNLQNDESNGTALTSTRCLKSWTLAPHWVSV